MQIFFAVPEIMLELVALVFERVKGFVLNLPSGASSTHYFINIFVCNFVIRGPATVTFVNFFSLYLFPFTFQEGDFMPNIANADIKGLSKIT